MCAALLLLGSESRAERYVVDRVIAVVGDQPVLLSSLEQRAAPQLSVVERTVTTTGERLIARAKVYRQVLERLVEEQLVRRDASDRGVTVASADIEMALDQVAKQNGMSRTRLLAEVERAAGMSEAQYRRELGYQILEGKMLQLEMQQRNAFVQEEELRAIHARLQQEDPDGTLPFEQARAELAAQVQVERMQRLRTEWIARLRLQAFVEIRWSP
jgi:peptidyl-prolyl cis-trans isomerase SurA